MSDEEGFGTDLGRETSVPRGQVRDLSTFVAAARSRLGYLGIRAAIGRRLGLTLAAAASCAAARPVVWPLHDGSPWRAVIRAFVLGLVGACLVLAVVIVRAWRSRPALLASARRVDDALGLAEVVSSGFAFERDRRDDDMAAFAIESAHRAIAGAQIERVLGPAPRRRSKGESRWLVGGTVAVVLGLSFGAVDRIVVERVIHPPTSREVAAAAALKQAAEAAASSPRDLDADQKDKAQQLVDAARRASEAAERGDRKGARDALEDMRKASRALEAEQREQGRSLRALRDELEGSAAAGRSDATRPSATASEALAKLKRELDAAGADKDAVQKMIDRLERAESSARAATEGARAGSEKSGASASGKKDASSKGKSAKEAAWSRAATALKEAREAAARGDADAAKRAMERAEREISALEKATAEASEAGARVADEASELDRSMHAAMTGDPSSGKTGAGEGDPRSGKGADGAGASKHASKGKAEAGGAPGGGPGGSERSSGPEQRRVTVDGNLQARTDVREGERAVSAIEGMGRGDDPRAYREVFPSYDTVVEDGLREDVVPAARRPTVRRYFSSIRPGGDADESRK